MNVQNQALVLEEEYEVSRDASRLLSDREASNVGLCHCGSAKLRFELFAAVFGSYMEIKASYIFFFPNSLQKMKEKDLDSWKNIRGPRPWEDSRQYQEQQRSRQNNE